MEWKCLGNCKRKIVLELADKVYDEHGALIVPCPDCGFKHEVFKNKVKNYVPHNPLKFLANHY